MSRRSLFFFYLVAGIWTTYVCSSIIDKNNENKIKDGGSECRNIVYQFGGSSRQCIIKQDIEDAVKNVCNLQNRSNESAGEQLQRLFKKIETMEKGLDEKLEKMETLGNRTVRELGKMEALENRIEDKLDKIAQRMIAGTNGSCTCNRTCPVGYVYYQADTFCYKLYNMCKSWSEARNVCQQQGGDLISLQISNFDTFDAIARLKYGGCSNSFVWVGATDTGSVGTWFWLNGVKLNSVFWYPGEPTGPGEHCAHFNYWKNKLNDFACSTTSNFLCQIQM